MSAEDPVIAASNETSGPDRVDSTVIPPPEHLAVKDVSTVLDSPPPEPVIEQPAETAQTTSDDTLSHLLKHDTNIPNPTPTNLSGVETATFVSVELLNFLFFPCCTLWGMISLYVISSIHVSCATPPLPGLFPSH